MVPAPPRGTFLMATPVPRHAGDLSYGGRKTEVIGFQALFEYPTWVYKAGADHDHGSLAYENDPL